MPVENETKSKKALFGSCFVSDLNPLVWSLIGSEHKLSETFGRPWACALARFPSLISSAWTSLPLSLHAWLKLGHIKPIQAYFGIFPSVIAKPWAPNQPPTPSDKRGFANYALLSSEYVLLVQFHLCLWSLAFWLSPRFCSSSSVVVLFA
jgi:hypothetical protein